MKRLVILLLALSMIVLSACAPSNPPAAQSSSPEAAQSLVVSGGGNNKTYTRPALEALPASQADFKGVSYKGVSVSTLIKDAGFDPTQVKAIKAVAADGFTVNYEPAQVIKDDVIVAYATANGDLSKDDGAFRMVLPGAEGKLNVRMLTELQVIK